MTIDECWLKWRDLLLKAVYNFIPVKSIKDINSPPWIDGEVRHLACRSEIYTTLKKYCQNRFVIRIQKLRSLSQCIKTLIRRKHREYLKRIESSFDRNPKIFWSYHKAVLHYKEKHSAAVTYKSITAKNPADKAELFNSYFTSVFAQSAFDIDTSLDSDSNTQISDITLTPKEIAGCLYNLNNSKICKRFRRNSSQDTKGRKLPNCPQPMRLVQSFPIYRAPSLGMEIS